MYKVGYARVGICGPRQWACWPPMVRENGAVSEPVGGPAYQQVARDLRRRIALAEFPVGSAIPSTARLRERYGVSVTVVRAAVAQLRADGLVTGHPGKGVFVSSTPDAAAERAATVEDLARQVEELRAELRRAVPGQGESAAEVVALRRQVGQLRAQVSDLYDKLGIPHPGDQPGGVAE
jgi:DNA-binding FadR family transcriptional regulator